MSKRQLLTDQLRTKVTRGYYALKALPSERQLAAESGVAYMTARRAVQQLIEEGLVVRRSNGRLEINRVGDSEDRALQVAFLRPTSRPHHPDVYRVALERCMSSRKGSIHIVEFLHWDDPLVNDALVGYDGVFVIPSTEPIPANLAKRFAALVRPLVVLGIDYSHFGVPSITHIPPIYAQSLLDHLEMVGCKRIACLNTQPHDFTIRDRIDQWRIWAVVHGHKEILMDHPVESYSSAFTQAYLVVAEAIKSGKFDADGLMCITTPAAIGAMRALHEAGIVPGTEVAICSLDGEGVAPYLIPSLTAVEEPDPTKYIMYCLEWMAAGGGAWKGPLHMQPTEVPLVIRDSTTLFNRSRLEIV